MNFIVPFGSSIIGAIIGGVFLLAGQKWNNLRICRSNSRIIFTAFLREASSLDNNIIRRGISYNATIEATIDVQTQVYHEHEKFLIQCFNPVDLDAIYTKVKEIENQQKIVISSKTPPDRQTSYGIICSIQGGLIQILEQLKPHACSRFDKNTAKSFDIVISNLNESFRRFIDTPDLSSRFLLIFPKR